MNISKNQIVMLSIGGVSLVVLAVLGYLAFDAYSAKSEATESSESNAAAVRSLLGAAISPDPASVAAVNKNRDALAGWTEAAVSTVAAGDRVIAADVNEAAFKQKLVDEARTLSNLPGGVDGKIMKDVSAFGFPDLVAGDKLPEKAELPRLQRLWGDVCTFVKTLSDCGVIEVVRIEPGIAKQPQAAAEPKDAKRSRNRRRKDAEEEKPAYTDEKYVVEFRARPAALVKAVNALATCERFIVVETLDFSREGDMIGKALGEGSKRSSDAEQQSSRPRRRRRGAAEAEFGADAAEQNIAADAGKSVVNDPAKEDQFLVRAIITTYDFGSAAKVAADEAAPASVAEDGKNEKEGDE
ncbi:MAG: Amuc_1100 family pilus-like protein [Kiritimatiellae bacterium]|nr:Amuc_1100 family pilus-like protein [Kiritimatiellia bacterium]